MSEKLELRVDLNAPIVPGEGAAGLHLGQNVSDVADHDGIHFATEQSKPAIPDLEPSTFLRCESVGVCTKNEVITGISVRGNYRGGVYDRIYLGDPLGRMVSAFGPVGEDDEDNLVAVNVPGLCFELPAALFADADLAPYSRAWLDRIRDGPICEVFVFSTKCDCGSELQDRPDPAHCQGCGLIVFEALDL